MTARPFVPAALMACMTMPAAFAADVHNDGVYIFDSDAGLSDLLVDDVGVFQGEVCVGSGCDSNETFASPTELKIHSTNPGIEFSDSSTGNFPDRSWRLRINDVGLMGIDRFSIEDLDAGRLPFTIEGNARENALYVLSSGEVGLGTSLPLSNLHIVGGSSAAVRLEDTIGTPYSWDIRADNSDFTIQDASAGTVPVIIENGAPLASLNIEGNGDIGLGTFAPSVPLHVLRGNGTSSILVEETSAGTLGQLTLRNNGITFFTLEDTSIAAGNNTGRSWNFQNQAGTFRVTTAPGGAGEIEMILTPAGDLTIEGELTTSGSTCGGGCDAVFSDDYDLPSIADHAKAMFALGHLPNVGPTPENQPINLSDKLGRILNELEHAHIYIDQLHREIEDLKADARAADRLRLVVARQSARLSRLETLLDD